MAETSSRGSSSPVPDAVGIQATADVTAGYRDPTGKTGNQPERLAWFRGLGLGMFIQYGWAPADRNEAHQYLGFGLLYKGLIRGRDEDLLGAGVAHLRFSNCLPDQSTETTIELFYKAPLTLNVTIQPDMQYIANPDGQGRDAFVAGVRFEIVL